MKEIILTSEQTRAYCQTMLSELKLDGSETVIFKKTDKSPTARQRRLWFMWCREVALSGLGQDDTVEAVHTRAKWKFVRPLLLESDEVFGIIYNHFMKVVENSPNKPDQCIQFAERYISTEALTKEQRIKSLDDFMRWWVGRGVNLTQPELQGVDLKKGRMI